VKRSAVASVEGTFVTEFLGRLSETLGLGVVVSHLGGAPSGADFGDASLGTTSPGGILWTNPSLESLFPGAFTAGRSVHEVLDEVTDVDTRGFPYVVGPAGDEIGEEVLRGGTLRRSLAHDPSRLFRLFELPLCEDEDAPLVAHCLLDITPEKALFETFRNTVHQLSSMKEIIDLLYESMGTGDLIKLILVSVTARQGCGFNRAFFLERSGTRLRGRLGIGPASAEEAHTIWTRLSESNLNLRETLQHFSGTDGPPDLVTQALVGRMNLPLDDGKGGGEPHGIGDACRKGRPALVTASSALPGAEGDLFRMLGVDEIAVVPLTIRERLAGVLLADNFITRKPISDGDLEVLKTFSVYAGIALERSSLYDELTRNLTDLRRAHRERQENHKRLLQAEKLSALGSLAASVSHEIRNPLVAIGGLARSVLEDEQLGDESREALEIVVSEVRRLERFLTGTLDFAKPEVESLAPVDLAKLIRDVSSTFREEIHRSGIELQLSAPDEPLTVTVSQNAVRGALSNLLKNAIEAVEEGGRIRVGLKILGQEPSGPGDDVMERRKLIEIEVADTGPGIPTEVRALIFEPFFTTKKNGTGIGLAITKQHIRNLGGRVSLESHPPFNTVFRVTLPAKAGTL